MGLLDGKKVLVTGARKGIGRGIAYAVAKEGADVGINDYIDDEETQKTISLVESVGKKSSKHIGDVSKKTNIDSIIVLLAIRNGQFEKTLISQDDLESYKLKWLSRLEKFHKGI